MTVRLQREDFDAAAEAAALTRGRTDVGAIVTFTGLCRGAESGEPIAALTLEHYPGMAEAEIARPVVGKGQVLDRLNERYGRFSLSELLKVPMDDVRASSPAASHAFSADDDLRQRMHDRIGQGSPVVLLNPNASDLLPLRKWELSKFIELVRQLLERHPGARIALTGGPGEQAAALDEAPLEWVP